MARNIGPSLAQVEKLVGMMEARPDLASGHARTANARTRMRNGWIEIARILNSEGNGCIKDGKMWAKEQEDTISLPTGSEPANSDQSQSILQQIPGPSSYHPEVMVVEDEPPQRDIPAPTSIGECSLREEAVSPVAVLIPTPGDEAVGVHLPLQDDNETVSLSDGDRGPERRPAVREVPPVAVRPVGARRRILVATPSPRRRLVLTSQRRSGAGGSPQRRRDVHVSPRAARGGVPASRRRLQRRSPPSQHRSEMASLTERFIAIEERRVDADHAIARSLEMFAEGHRVIAEAIHRLTNIAQQIFETRQQI